MNAALVWSKKNWPVIVSGVVILGSLPTAWYFSDAWNKSIQKKAQDTGTADLGKTKVSVKYLIPSPIPGQPDITLTDAPNDELTRRFRAIKDELGRQTKAVIDRVTAFNRGVGADAQAVGRTEHAVLVAELFPGPSQARINETAFPGKSAADIQAMTPEQSSGALAKALRDLTEPALRRMEDKLLGKRDNPDLSAGLVRLANGGEPPAASEVLMKVQERVERARQQMIQVSREPTAEEQAKLAELAQQARVGLYQGGAKAFSVYMSRSAIGAADRTNQNTANSMRPIATEAAFRANPSLVNDRDLFLFQWDQWILSDILSAVRQVNMEGGKPTSVDKSVVKRVERIAAMSFNPLEPSAHSSAPDPMAGTTEATPVAPGALIKPDYSVSITGRTTSPTNPDYDVRQGTIVAVVSSERLPAFLDSLTRANFNTVLQVSLAEVNVKEELEKGFFYGSEHVVRATITVESVWLRSWTGPLMPASVKKLLGVPEPVVAEAPK